MRAVAARPADRPFAVIKVDSTLIFVALLALSNALTPLMYDLTGQRAEGYTDANPYRLATSLAIYTISAGLLFFTLNDAKRVIERAPLMVLAFALPLISMAWSVDLDTTFRRAMAYFLTGVFCLYLATRLTPEEFMRRMLTVLFVGGVASLLYAVLVPKFGIHQDAVLHGAWKGVYGHKNDLGRISSIAVITAAFCQPVTKTQSRMRWATIAIFLFLVVMSQSRTNWFILLGSCCLTPIVKILRWRRLSLGVRVAIVIFLTLSVVLTASVAADQLLSAAGRDATLSGRHTLWRGVNNIIAAKYPVLGAGYGAFFTENGAIHDLAPYLTYWTGIPNHAHSGYLNVRADLGLPGTIILTALIVVLGARLVRLLIREPNRRVWMGFTCLFFLFLVNNYTESVSFKHSDIAWVIFVMIYLYTAIQPANVRAPRRTEVRRPAPFPTSPAKIAP